MLSIVAAGCGGGTGDPNAVEVSGTVTYDGKPLKTGSIAFASSSSRVGGPIDTNGRYTVRVVPGDYQIAIITMGTPPPKGQPAGGTKPDSGADLSKMTGPAPAKMSPGSPPKAGAAPGSAQEISPGTAPKGLLPKKYAKPETSGLAATVKDGKNEVNFDLTP